jgi:hypothetical protein
VFADAKLEKRGKRGGKEEKGMEKGGTTRKTRV